MMEEKETIEQEIKKIRKNLKRISKETGIKMKELIPIMSQRELVLINNQLRAIHEHLEALEGQDAKETA
jgi:hypothetical protein